MVTKPRGGISYETDIDRIDILESEILPYKEYSITHQKNVEYQGVYADFLEAKDVDVLTILDNETYIDMYIYDEKKLVRNGTNELTDVLLKTIRELKLKELLNE